MEEMTKVAVDAMGGDYAPSEAIKGAVAAVNEKENVEVFLVGKQEVLEKELSSCTYPKERIHIVGASEVIETGEPPVAAIRGKKMCIRDSHYHSSRTGYRRYYSKGLYLSCGK